MYGIEGYLIAFLLGMVVMVCVYFITRSPRR
jgi:hypothetical protein